MYFNKSPQHYKANHVVVKQNVDCIGLIVLPRANLPFDKTNNLLLIFNRSQ